LQLQPGADGTELAQGLSDHVTYMVGNGLNGAKLEVNPPELGPVELRIAVSAGHAQVWMTSHSAVTRDALESSSPKLREMLGAQGFGQVSVDVSQRSFQDRSGHAQPYQRMSAGDSGTSGGAAAAAIAGPAPRRSQGSLDTYA
jgi:flagellar hook-length control protein FliK